MVQRLPRGRQARALDRAGPHQALGSRWLRQRLQHQMPMRRLSPHAHRRAVRPSG